MDVIIYPCPNRSLYDWLQWFPAVHTDISTHDCVRFMYAALSRGLLEFKHAYDATSLSGDEFGETMYMMHDNDPQNGRDSVLNHQPHDRLLNRLCGEFTVSPVNSMHKWPVTQKMFPFDDVIMSGIGDCNSHNRRYRRANNVEAWRIHCHSFISRSWWRHQTFSALLVWICFVLHFVANWQFEPSFIWNIEWIKTLYWLDVCF